MNDTELAPAISGRAILWGLAIVSPFWVATAAVIYVVTH